MIIQDDESTPLSPRLLRQRKVSSSSQVAKFPGVTDPDPKYLAVTVCIDA